MTQEIKERLEQKAANFGKLCDPNNETIEKQADLRFGFLRGAQTVLENPRSFCLYSLEDMRKSFYAGHNLCDDEWRDKRKLTGFDEFMEELQ